MTTYPEIRPEGTVLSQIEYLAHAQDAVDTKAMISPEPQALMRMLNWHIWESEIRGLYGRKLLVESKYYQAPCPEGKLLHDDKHHIFQRAVRMVATLSGVHVETGPVHRTPQVFLDFRSPEGFEWTQQKGVEQCAESVLFQEAIRFRGLEVLPKGISLAAMAEVATAAHLS
ncbi:hypothetical protein KDA06_01985 [Candidatus Saccharibacteria bacterium]|nr:hypothetical protein [Candidatus Saccharibacteria bacterium]HPR09920.1 hypothetical protein [Candidatus Saccharibacteria bacterium]